MQGKEVQKALRSDSWQEKVLVDLEMRCNMVKSKRLEVRFLEKKSKQIIRSDLG